MQTFPPIQAPDQHLPAAWGFPATSPMAPPPPQAPVSGGGATYADPTVTRVRWGRILLVAAGVALLAFGMWQGMRGTDGATPGATTPTVNGGGSDDLDAARVARLGIDDAPAAGVDATPATAPTDPSSAAGASPPLSAPAPAIGAARSTARPGRARPGRTGRAARAGGGASAMTRPAPARAAGPTVSGGGGATASAKLPYTGAETWIAGVLGVLVLAGGIAMHVNAVRIGMTAMLYRRGILLRPVDCARLAQEHGLSRLRIAVSDVLHRLLEEPDAAAEYVSARSAFAR